MALTVFTSDTHTVWQISPVTDTNSSVPGSPISLLGATSATVRFLPQGRPAYTGQGTTTMGTSSVNYHPASTDLQATQRVQVQVTVLYSDGSALPLQPLVFQILEAE